jgi:hypothetical protein
MHGRRGGDPLPQIVDSRAADRRSGWAPNQGSVIYEQTRVRAPAELLSRTGRVGAENSVTSRDLQILVYETAESISSQRPDGCAGGRGSGACRRLLIQRPMWAMSVVVLEVLL